MALRFAECELGLGVYYTNESLTEGIFAGSIEVQGDGSVIYNGQAGIEYGADGLEQILSKMKELQNANKRTTDPS